MPTGEGTGGTGASGTGGQGGLGDGGAGGGGGEIGLGASLHGTQAFGGSFSGDTGNVNAGLDGVDATGQLPGGVVSALGMLLGLPPGIALGLSKALDGVSVSGIRSGPAAGDQGGDGAVADVNQILNQVIGSNPTTLAAQIQADAITQGNQSFRAALDEAISGIRTGSDRNLEMLNPFIGAGTGALDNVIAGQTVAGLDDRLSQIMGTDAFQALKAERLRDVEGSLGAAGLTRSGAAAEAVSRVSPELAFEIESLLTGRSNTLANTGLSAATTASDFNSNIERAIAQMIMTGGLSSQNAITGAAGATASGILGNQQIQSEANAASDANQTALILGALNFLGDSGFFD